jgi:hypothetical protein
LAVVALDLGDQIAVAINRRRRRAEPHGVTGQEARELRARLLSQASVAGGQAQRGEADGPAVGQRQPVAGEHVRDRERRAPDELFGADGPCPQQQSERAEPEPCCRKHLR